MTFTKERLQKIVSDSQINQGSEFAMMARQLLATMEQEPVAFRFWPEGDEPSGFIVDSINDPANNPGEVDADGRQWVSSPLYTAPPAPVVPDELLSAMEEVLRISDRDHDAWHKAKAGIVSCRAAMLQGADDNSPAVADGKTPSMEVLTSQMLFDGHTVLEGEFGFIGYERAYEILRKIHSAMLAAAPQQEVK